MMCFFNVLAEKEFKAYLVWLMPSIEGRRIDSELLYFSKETSKGFVINVVT